MYTDLISTLIDVTCQNNQAEVVWDESGGMLTSREPGIQSMIADMDSLTIPTECLVKDGKQSE